MKVRKLLKFGLIAGGVGGFATAALAQREFRKLDKELFKKAHESEKSGVLELEPEELVQYPWDDDSWEFKKVRLIGFAGDDRHFVRRERDGKPGFLVFVPFYTALDSLANKEYDEEEEIEPGRAVGIMVNVGWIPANKREAVTESLEFGETLVFPPGVGTPGKTVTLPVTNLSTVVLADGEDVPEDQPSLTVIEGFLRRPEPRNRLLGRWNNYFLHQQSQISLRRMLRHESLENADVADQFYLELAVDDLAEQPDAFPIPASFADPYKYYELYEKKSRLHNGLKSIAFWSGSVFLSALLL